MRDVKLRVTVTAENRHNLLALAPIATELGVQTIVFKPFDSKGVASKQSHLALSRRQWDEIAEDLRQRWPANALPLVVGDGMPTRPAGFAALIPSFGCVGGNTSASIMANGDVTGCDAVPASGAWNVKERSFQDCWLESHEIKRWRAIPDNPQCRTCSHRSRCGGGCRVRALDAGRGLSGPDPFANCSLYAPEVPTSAATSTAETNTLAKLPMLRD